jgi:hypothetical protein
MNYGGQRQMKRGVQALAVAFLAGALLVPAATAQPAGPPGNDDGNGGGGGKPSFAGSGKPSFAGSGKPSFAGGVDGAGEAGRARADRAQSEAQAQQGGGPARANPAWACKSERDAMGEEAFTEAFGTNENDANAFGMCVSEEAEAQAEASDDEETEGEGSASLSETSTVDAVLATALLPF